MKTMRIFAGIILHPAKVVWMKCYRKQENELLARGADRRYNFKAWARMHDMSEVTNTAYTSSDIYKQIFGKDMCSHLNGY